MIGTEPKNFYKSDQESKMFDAGAGNLDSGSTAFLLVCWK